MHFHLIYQSSSIYFMYHSTTHSFPSDSFYRSWSFHSHHIHHIWYCSYCIAFQPHCLSFFNQSHLWKLGVSLDKILLWNIHCIILKLNSDGITTPCHFIRNTTVPLSILKKETVKVILNFSCLPCHIHHVTYLTLLHFIF